MAHPGGRPSKYNKRLAEIAEKYVDETQFPTMQGLCLLLDVSDDTVTAWSDIDSPQYNKQFSGTIVKLKRKQAGDLMEGGLTERYNASMAKFLLSANHGMRERSDVTTNDEKLEGTPVLIDWGDKNKKDS